MGDSRTIREQVLEQGPVDVLHRPVIAWLRFWTQGWRFHGRASRTEFLWVVFLEVVAVIGVLWLVQQLGITARWTMYADPFGVVPSPQVAFHLFEARGSSGVDRWWFGFGSGKDSWPDGWDVAIITGLLVTAVPRWSLLVRRLHDRNRTGLWILLLVFTGPIGWLVVTGMVLRSSHPEGARFDRGLFTGREAPAGTERPALVEATEA